MTLSNIIAICISFTALIVNLLFRYIDKKKKNLYYIIKNEVIIENKKNDEKLILTYENEKINQLVKTEVLIFNKSNKTIEYSEFGKTEILQLTFSKETKIFSVEISEFDNPNVNFSFNLDRESIKLNFDYLKNGNYVLLKIISNENSIKNPIMLGEFIKDGEVVEFNKSNYFMRELIRLFIGVILVSLIGVNFKIKDEYIVIFGLIYGFVIPNIIRFFIYKKLDKRIMNIIKE